MIKETTIYHCRSCESQNLIKNGHSVNDKQQYICINCRYSGVINPNPKKQKETHRSVGKESGQTNHVERWNNTLRQWVSRYTRKTFSFSKSEKSDEYHNIVTHLFIRKYNLNISF